MPQQLLPRCSSYRALREESHRIPCVVSVEQSGRSLSAFRAIRLPPIRESLCCKLRKSCAAQVQAGAGQPNQPSGSISSDTNSLQKVLDQIDEPPAPSSSASGSSAMISLQEVPNQIDEPLAPPEDTRDIINLERNLEQDCNNGSISPQEAPQEGGAETLPEEACLSLDGLEKVLLEPGSRNICFQDMLTNLPDIQREGMGAPELHSSRSRRRHTKEACTRGSAYREPNAEPSGPRPPDTERVEVLGRDEDLTTPRVFESASFHLEQV
ncbi:unnamed protein product [Polarella glacialis]|uniref:Uncharacterized protein n=1 Tax=Polarella glacialis TaxID=89957 RepID=A0A813JF93_POLGL|nr:unnamed protein product [Polarella glacialis]